MSEKSTSEKATGNKSMNEGSIGGHLDSLSMNSLLVNSLLRYWLPPVLWMGVIFFLSAQPTLPYHPDTLLDSILKKAGHMVEYGILTFLLWRALSRGWGTLLWSPLVTAFLVSVLYAVSDEYHQTFVPGRNGTPVDVGIDAVGALVALLVLGGLGKKGRRE